MSNIIKINFEEQIQEKLSQNSIRIIKNKTLLAPGFWNGRNYSAEEISKAFERTDWNDKDVISLIADHNDDNFKGRPESIRDWLGFISNQHIDDRGYLVGDLNICDSDLATKLIDGKASFGISPFIRGNYDGQSQRDFVYNNFAVVVEPACKECYINEYLEDDNMNEKLSDISAFERIRKKIGKSVNEFYAVPRNPPSSSKLPIFDSSHVRNALARFNQTQFKDEQEKQKAKSKIMAAAKKFNIIVSNKLNETNSIELKGGLKNNKSNMEKEKLEENIEEPKEEVKEEVVEEVKSEEPKEESEKEVKSEEEPKEESEEKLMENLIKMAEKFLEKKKTVSPEDRLGNVEKTLSKLSEKLNKLSEDLQKLSEVQSVKDETTLNKEKLSAKKLTKEVTKLSNDNQFTFNKLNESKGSVELAHIMGYN